MVDGENNGNGPTQQGVPELQPVPVVPTSRDELERQIDDKLAAGGMHRVDIPSHAREVFITGLDGTKYSREEIIALLETSLEMHGGEEGLRLNNFEPEDVEKILTLVTSPSKKTHT